MTTELFRQALSLHAQGRLAEAQALYRRLLAEKPANYQVQYRLALSLFQQQRHGEALPVIASALSFHPDAWDGLLLKGALMASAGRHEEALAEFDRVLTLKPGDATALQNRALVFFQMNRLNEAVAAFDAFLAKMPGSADGWVTRGAALQQLSRAEESLASYDKALALAPSHAIAWQNRGTLLLSLGRFEEALESFDNTLKQARHAGALRGRASALRGLFRFEEALETLDQAGQAGFRDQALGRERAALADAVSLFGGEPEGPGAAKTWCDRACYLQVHQRLDEALEALDRALSINSNYPDALVSKGQVLTELKRTEEGMAAYRRHAELAFGNQPVTQAGDPPHKQRHDAEQRAFLAGQGIAGDVFRLEKGARAARAVNPANGQEASERWRSSDPRLVVIDDLLMPEALEGLRRFCRGSTMWRRAYQGGYLGAMPEYGFACPLLAQIADELRQVFPAIIGDHGLRLLWGFKYDSNLSGIRIHGDQAAVNVNFWIAPEQANRDPRTGGLVVWPVKPPGDWDFARYNADDAAIRAFLTAKGGTPIVVPHRANRAVIFDSDLFHETDRLDFADGYLNRRTNITMLYGRRTFHGG